jgi:hypothetical protein
MGHPLTRIAGPQRPRGSAIAGRLSVQNLQAMLVAAIEEMAADRNVERFSGLNKDLLAVRRGEREAGWFCSRCGQAIPESSTLCIRARR